MNHRELFEAASSQWVSFSKYEIKTKNGVEYLTPAADSEIDSYNPLDIAEGLVENALEMGRLLCRPSLTKAERNTILIHFAENYGPMGFLTSIPLNGNFFEYPHVFFGRNPYFDVDMMETGDYFDFFKPFGIKEGQPKGFTLPLALLSGKTLEYGILFSRNYAERVDWLVRLFQEFYTHFSACGAFTNTDNPALKAAYADTIAGFREYGLGFNMRMTDKPTMVWDFVSLKQIIETVYAVMISQPDTPLRMCKHCGKAFIAAHGRSEFCGTKCRNQFNVYKWRAKQRAENDGDEDELEP